MLVQYGVLMQLEVAVRLGSVLAPCTHLSFVVWSSCGCWVSLDGLVSADCILLVLADGLRPLVVHCVARPLCAPPGCGVLARGPPVEGRRALWSWRLGVRGIGELPALWGTGGLRGLRWRAMRLRSACPRGVGPRVASARVVHGSRTVYGWPYGGAVALGGAGVLVGARGRG